jgi:hypothetical protein
MKRFTIHVPRARNSCTSYAIENIDYLTESYSYCYRFITSSNILSSNPIINPLITLVLNILRKKTKEVGSNLGVKVLNYDLLFIIERRPITLIRVKVDLTII